MQTRKCVVDVARVLHAVARNAENALALHELRAVPLLLEALRQRVHFRLVPLLLTTAASSL